MNYVLGKDIFNILNHVIFSAKTQISKPIDVSVFMFDLRMINLNRIRIGQASSDTYMLSGYELIDTETISMSSQNMKFVVE
jgi:hypothetical protein